ncbi:MAG: GNAT family N-acetyltransferase [Saezia sp.]
MCKQAVNIRSYKSDADVNFVITSQLQLYKAEYGFDSDVWKEYLMGGVRQLMAHFNPAKDCLYILEVDGKLAGSIAITHAEDTAAQLRFFFVQEETRGMGAGGMLVDKVLDSCRDKGYHRVFLWTFSTLHVARHLYAQKGFVLTETQQNSDWGTPILEERWEMVLGNGSVIFGNNFPTSLLI